MNGATPRPSPSADFFEFGPFKLEISTRSLYRGEEFVPVTPKALDTLFVLVEESGRLVSKDELMQRVWPDAYVEEGSIANNISMLRKLLNPYFEGDGPIATVARRGYRFVEPVRLRNATAQISLATDSGTGKLNEAARKAVEIIDAMKTAPKEPVGENFSSPALEGGSDATPHVTLHVTSNAAPSVLLTAAVVLVAATVALTVFLRPVATQANSLPGQMETSRAGLSSNRNALSHYFLGLDALRNHDMQRSTEFLEKATQADPAFALAHSTLSIAWRVLGHDDKSQAAAKIAFDLSSKLGREDQLAVQGAYYEVMSDWPRAIEKYQALWNFFPDNPAYALKLVHQQLLGDRLDDARRTLDQMRALPPPSDSDPRFDQVEADWFFRQERFAEVIATTTKGVANAKARKSAQLEARMLLLQGRAEFRLGAVDRARGLFKEAQQLFEQLGDQGGVAEVLRADGKALASRGDLEEGKQRLDRALQIAQGISHQRLIPDILSTRAELLQKMYKFEAAKADAEAAKALIASNATDRD
ncbi:MAG TPA: winged helix-turn-helix domain-containing protein [Vicinamibacterales bacterium]|nr:winged helix-turn-helix domain-containing protein [Vicinamibacterales bacterium]